MVNFLKIPCLGATHTRRKEKVNNASALYKYEEQKSMGLSPNASHCVRMELAYATAGKGLNQMAGS